MIPYLPRFDAAVRDGLFRTHRHATFWAMAFWAIFAASGLVSDAVPAHPYIWPWCCCLLWSWVVFLVTHYFYRSKMRRTLERLDAAAESRSDGGET